MEIKQFTYLFSRVNYTNGLPTANDDSGK